MYERRPFPWQFKIIVACAAIIMSGCEPEDPDYVEGGDPLPQSSRTNDGPQDTPLTDGESNAPSAAGGQPASAGISDNGSFDSDPDREPLGGMSAAPGDLPEPDISDLGGPCGQPEDGFGYCADTGEREDDTRPNCSGEFVSGLCEGPSNIQCCINHFCTNADGVEGVCMGPAMCNQFEGTGSPFKTFCPGNESIRCCTGFIGFPME